MHGYTSTHHRTIFLSQNILFNVFYFICCVINLAPISTQKIFIFKWSKLGLNSNFQPRFFLVLQGFQEICRYLAVANKKNFNHKFTPILHCQDMPIFARFYRTSRQSYFIFYLLHFRVIKWHIIAHFFLV